MVKSHALVDLTLDSEGEGRTKAGSKSTQKVREALSSKKDRGPQSQVSLPYGKLFGTF